MKTVIEVGFILAVQDWFKTHIKAPGIRSNVANSGDSFVLPVSLTI